MRSWLCGQARPRADQVIGHRYPPAEVSSGDSTTRGIGELPARSRAESCRTVLAVLLSTEDLDGVLELAVELARGRCARLAMIALAPELPAAAYLSLLATVWSVEDERRGHLECAAQLCTRAIERVPDGVPVEFRVVEGHPRHVVPRALAQSQYGAIVLQHRSIRKAGLKRLTRHCREQKIDLFLAGDEQKVSGRLP